MYRTGQNVDRWIDVNDPSTQQLLTRVPETSHSDMVKIVDRAQEAFYEWRDSSVLRRQAVMLKSVPLPSPARKRGEWRPGPPARESCADTSLVRSPRRRLATLIREHHDDIANSIVLEQGKTFADAKGDVLRGLQVVDAAIGMPSLIMGEKLEVSKDMDTETRRVPLGVGAAICP